MFKSMANKGATTRRSVFATLLISYLSVFIIPVIIGSIVYVKIEQIMIDNAYRSNAAMLEQIKHVMDGRTQEIDYLMRQIAFNPKQQSLMGAGVEPQSTQEQYQFIEFMRELSRYSAFNSLFYDFYVYFANTDTILTPTLKTDSKTFYSKIYAYEDLDYEQYRSEILLGKHFKSYLPSRTMNYGAKSDAVITYVQSLPIDQFSTVKGNLVILIHEQQIRQILQEIEGLHDGSIYILNGENKVIMGPETGGPTVDAIIASLSDQESVSLHLGSRGEQQRLAAYTRSSVNGWTYVSMFPKDVVLEQVYSVKRWSIVTVLACLMLGILICLYMTRKHYSPIRDVVNTIIQGRSGSRPGKENELKLIKHTIEELFGKEHQLENKISQQMPIIQMDFLSRLVRGQVDSKSISDDDLTFMGIQFEHDHFVVILIDIDDGTQFMREDSEREWALMRFIVLNFCHELPGESNYSFELEKNRIIVLMNAAADSSEADQSWKDFIHQLLELMHSRFHTTISIGVSAKHQGLDRIVEGYDEAVLAISYKWTMGSKSILYYEEMNPTATDTYRFPMDLEVQLVNYTKNGDKDNMERLLDKIYEMNFSHNRLTPEMGQWLLHDLQSTLLKMVDTVRIDVKSMLSEGDSLKLVSDAITAEQSYKQIKWMFATVCERIRAERTDHSELIYERMTRFIEENYQDNNLSLTMIADHFNLNAVYVSSFFKKHSGENITDFMTRTRIDHAKRLLAGDLTVNEIAQQVGYSNNIVLTKVFKKLEGITPGAYRRDRQENDQGEGEMS
jgi:two-component system, response regulator YesN